MDSINVYIAFVNEPFCVDVFKDTTVEDVIIQVCKLLEIGPVARLLFSLYYETSAGIAWLNLPQKIVEIESSNFKFAIRFNITDTDRLKQIDESAYDFYFKQARYKILSDNFSKEEYEIHRADIMGLSIIDMFRATIEDGLSNEQVLEDYKRYVPLKAIRRHKMFLRRPVTEKFNQIRVRNVSPLFVKCGYLEQFKGVFPDHLKEEYKGMVNDGTENAREVTICVNPFDKSYPGISFKTENKEELEHCCSMHDLCFITKQRDDVMLHRKCGVPVFLKFHNNVDTMSFITLLVGYYRLMIKWMFILYNECESPSSRTLRQLKCHGPVGAEYAYTKLKEKKQNKPGCFILRESDLAFGAYYVDICIKNSKSKLPVTYKIEMTKEEMYRVAGFEKEYPSLAQLLREETWGNADIVLKECVPPSEYDKPISLFCVDKDDELNGPDGSEDHLPPVNSTACINTRNLMVFKNKPLEGNNPFTAVYRSIWRETITVKHDVALKVLRENHQECLTEFLSLASRWAAVNSGAIVKLFGVTICSPISLVMEYLPLGQLDMFLADPENRPYLTKVALVEASVSLANALYHLEEAKFVHGYIRCHKLLVSNCSDTSFGVRLADPGLYRPYQETDLHWIPPECHNNMVEAKSSIDADVWAFATTLWQIFSYGECPPFGNVVTIKKFYCDGKKHLPRPQACPPNVYQVMLECWNYDVDARHKPQAIMRDINHIFYQVYNGRRKNDYDEIEMQPKDQTFGDSVPESQPSVESEFEYPPQSSESGNSGLADDLRVSYETENDKFNYSYLPNAQPTSPYPDLGGIGQSKSNAGIYSLNSVQSIFELDNEWQVIFKGIIGEGNYGEVYRGELIQLADDNKRQTVAIKRMKGEATSNFKKEIKMMMTLKHPNIVEIKGILQETELLLVLEYVDNGSLKSYLQYNRDRLTTQLLLNFALGIAKGMKYLSDRKIVHRDLAARNILITKEFRAKISDFGLARFTENEDYYLFKSKNYLPVQWYAPESIEHAKFSTRSDVWSYGVTLWEMFSYGDDPELPGVNDTDDIPKVLKENVRLPMPLTCTQDIFTNIIFPCWNYEANLRPTFSDLRKRIEDMFTPPEEWRSTMTN